MSTLLEIEEAIKSLPADQIAELACWLDDMQSVRGIVSSPPEECLAAQVEVARLRMQALDLGETEEIPGETPHAELRKGLKGRKGPKDSLTYG